MSTIKTINPSMLAALNTSQATAAEPAWAETTVRYLRAKHPQYVRTQLSERAEHALSRALSRMSYGKVHADRVGLANKEYEQILDALAKIWTRENHDTMVGWLKIGGYPQEAREEAARLKEENLAVPQVETPTEVEGVINGLAAPQVEITLDEILSDAERDEINPDHGSW